MPRGYKRNGEKCIPPSTKGKPSWNSGLKGYTNKGSFTREKSLGNTHGFKRGIPPWNKGKTWDEETKKKMIKFCKKGCTCKRHDILVNKLKSEKTKGENGSNWRGGITRKNLLIRTSLKSIRFRKSALERDNYKCVYCGDRRGGNLEIHHVKSFSQYPELRFEFSNVVTLCRKCHRKTENWGRQKVVKIKA